MKGIAVFFAIGLLLSASGTLAQIAAGGASTSADPSASTTQTGLPAAMSSARPDRTGAKRFGPDAAQPATAVPGARDTPADPHTGRNNPTGNVPSGKSANDQ